MAIREKITPKNLNVQQYFIRTNNRQNPYLLITGLDDVVGSGVYSFIIHGSSFLLQDSEVRFEAIDSRGNQISIAGVRNILKGNSRVVSFTIDDTIEDGEATIYVAAVLEDYLTDQGLVESVPQQFSGDENLLFTFRFDIDKEKNNNDEIIFKRPPVAVVTPKIKKVRTITKPDVSETVTEAEIVRTFYNPNRRELEVTVFDETGTKFEREMDGKEVTITNADIDLPGTKIFTAGRKNTALFRIPNPDVSEYTGNELISLLPDTVDEEENAKLSFTIDYNRLAQYNLVKLQEAAFATFDFRNLTTVSGDVEKIRIYGKSDTLQTDYNLINEYELLGQNSLVLEDIGNIGIFDNDDKLSNWNISTITTNTDVRGFANQYYSNRLESDGVSDSEISCSGSIQNTEIVFDVSVEDRGSGNKFIILDQYAPELTLVRGNIYRFNQSDPSNIGHPLEFRNLDDLSYSDGVNRVGTPGTSGSYTDIEIDNDTSASFKYYCTVHGNSMGNFIEVINEFENTEIYTDASSLDDIEINDIFYSSASRLSTWNGGDKWYGISTSDTGSSPYSFRINNSGSVQEIFNCPATSSTTIATSSALIPTIERDESILSAGVVINGVYDFVEKKEINGTELQTPRYKFQSDTNLILRRDTEYFIRFKAAVLEVTETDTRLDVYIVSDYLSGENNSIGKLIGSIRTNSNDVWEDGVEMIFTNESDIIDGKIAFVNTAGRWILSDIEISSELQKGFSPAEYKVDVPVDVKKDKQDIDFRVEFLDADDNKASIGLQIDNVIFDRPNLVIEGFDNFLSGSLFVGEATSSGIGLGLSDAGGAFIKSVPYDGFIDATTGGQSGFLLYSGSVASSVEDEYSGSLGVEIVKDEDNYLRFRTEPSLFEVKSDVFFFGNADTQFISGSNSSIEISSSNFHLDPKNNILIIRGAIRQSSDGTELSDFRNRGTWESDSIYLVNDIVQYEFENRTQSYIAVNDHTSSASDPNGPPEPDTSNNWEVFASAGTSGVGSSTVNLIASDQSIKYDETGGSPDPSSVTMTATAINTTGTVYYEFLLNGDSQQNTTSNIFTFDTEDNIDDMPQKAEVRIREGSENSSIVARDQVTVFGIQDGSDAYTVILTNEAHTLPATIST